MTAHISPKPRYTPTPADAVSTRALSKEDLRDACAAVVRAREALKVFPDDAQLKRQHRAAVAYVVRHNQGLVFTQARRVARRCKSLEIEDLVQWGNIGLLRALDTFELERNICFGTYAAWWCRSFIQRSLVSEDTDVRVPAHTLDARKRLNRVTTQFTIREGRTPTVAELAKEMGYSKSDGTVKGVPGAKGRPVGDGIAKVEHLRTLDAILAPASMDAEVHGSKNNGLDAATLHDFAPSHAPSPEEIALGREHEALAIGLIAILPERQRAVLVSRYWDEQTLAETGQQMRPRRVTRERTRQIEQEALGRLREAVRAGQGSAE